MKYILHKAKRITAAAAALMLSVSSFGSAFASAEVNPAEFWEKASGDYALKDYADKDDERAVNIYGELDRIVEKIWNYDEDITDYNAQYDTYYYGEKIIVPAEASTLSEFNEEFSKVNEEISDIFFMYRNDHPQAYFTSSVLISGGYSYNPSAPEQIINPFFTVAVTVDEKFISAEERQKYKTLIFDYIENAEEAEEFDSAYGKAKFLHDYLCGDLRYAFEDDGETPAEDYYTNNIIGAVDPSIGEGVCECYARTYEMLLNYYGVNNVFATGYGLDLGNGGGGPHAWNLVQLEDGEYYGFDATWDDGNDDQLSYWCFAKGTESDFDEAHIPDYECSDQYLYLLPEMAQRSFAPVEFTNASLTLTDGIIINFYADVNENAAKDDNYVHFTNDSGIDTMVKVSEAEETANGYKFSIKLRPDQMREDIKAQFIYADTGLGSESKTYSVAKYAESISTYPDSYSNAKDLVEKLMNYGTYSQLYTGYETDKITDADYSDYELYPSFNEKFSAVKTDNADGMDILGASLCLDAYTTIKINYRVDDPSSELSFVCDGNELDYEISGNTVSVYIRDILPQNLNRMYDIKAVCDGQTCDLKYGAYTYMKSALSYSGSDQKLKNLICSMFDYSVSAYLYSHPSESAPGTAS